MYFAIDTDKQEIKNDSGDVFTASQFQKIVERGAEKDTFYDMTQMTQRFVSYDYDWDALEKFYASDVLLDGICRI